MAEEVKEPQTAIPFSITCGISVVAALYVLLNLAFAAVLPAAKIIGSPVVAAALANSVAGRAMEISVSLLVSLSVLGTTHGSIMTGARYLFAAGAPELD